MSIIEFWENCIIDIDLVQLRGMSITVKGKRYKDPCRCLEIFGNTRIEKTGGNINIQNVINMPEKSIIEQYIPKTPNKTLPIGSGIYQPPFIWEDCSPLTMAVNFTYNTNALFRIFSNLADNGFISPNKINSLIERACTILCIIYKVNNSFILRYINNNINMFILSKIVENLVGSKVYNSSFQEPRLTFSTLEATLKEIAPYVSLNAKQQMACALGRGIAFLEDNISVGRDDRFSLDQVNSNTFKYVENRIAIDHRDLLLHKIEEAESWNESVSMCAILDDTSESVLDLLWMQNLLISFKNFHVYLLLNKAQISINFSSNMLSTVLQSPFFEPMRIRLGRQVYKCDTCCPLISYQSNFLSEDAWSVISGCDFIFVKGLNFFETCQNLHKDTFYSFVVYGPISCLYTGLFDYDAVFAYVPKGTTGYVHNKEHSKILRLTDVMKKRTESFSIQRRNI